MGAARCERLRLDDAMGPFHEGELAVQARAGVQSSAARVGGIIGDTIPPALIPFLRSARAVALGAADETGRVWATLLVGEPGFVDASPHRLRVRARPRAGDALHTLFARRAVGLTVADLATRRRVRVNGTLAAADDDGFGVVVDEAYVNCPKYIQARTPPTPDRAVGDAPPAADERDAPRDALSDALSDAQRLWLGAADTAFLATVGPTGRADASHRGGPPGFMVALDARRVAFPDYAGNTMFNSLGNLAADPRAGLVVPDFARGRLLQLSGTAAVDWRPEVAAAFPGAERVVLFAVERVREVAGAIPAGWSPPVASPFTPRADPLRGT